MKVDTVITLENDVNCLLLEQAKLENENYFLAVILTDSEEPSDDYVILKEIVEDGKEYVLRINDGYTLAKLVNLFTIDLSNSMAGIECAR